MSSTLVLHKGARECTLEELQAIPPPTPLGPKHFPIPFHKTLDITLSNLREAGFTPTKQRLAILREERFFATIDTESTLVQGITLSAAIMSSHDASLSYRFTAGSRTFACDNLSLSSDLSILIKRKHTKNGEECFANAMARTIREKLPQFQKQEAARIQYMQQKDIDDSFAESTLLRLYQDESILSPRTLPVALHEFRQPSFEDLERKNLWRLYSAITFAIGPRFKTNPQAAAAATLRLGHVLSLPYEPASAEVPHAVAP